MATTIQFSTPEELHSAGDDKIAYRFRFTTVDSQLIGQPEELARTVHRYVDVSITRTQAACWGIQRALIPKVLFEYGRRHIKAQLLLGNLKEREDVNLHTGNSESPCLFSPDRIPEPANYQFKVHNNPSASAQGIEEDLDRILTAGEKEIPQRTAVLIRLGAIPGTVTAEVQLPGQGGRKVYPDLRIVNGAIHLPVTLAFLSHSKADAQFVRVLADRLLQDGVLTWFDEKDLKPGGAWKLEIEKAIEKSDFVLVFLSSQSVTKKGYFQRELKYALEQHQLRPEGTRYIIPVVIGDCEPPASLREIHWLRADQSNWYERLLDALEI